MKKVTSLDLPAFYRASIGFDQLFNTLDRHYSSNHSSGYPPYNICQLNENEYLISLAVAGFSMENLEITYHQNTLKVVGTSPRVDDNVQYLHRGIGGRNFQREFTLADHIEVKSAKLNIGMLDIHLVRNVPEELQPKQIKISQVDDNVLTLSKN